MYVLIQLPPFSFLEMKLSKLHLYRERGETLASFPDLPRFFVLRFVFSIIHGSGIILNANQRTKNGGGLGTRLERHAVTVYN